MYQYSCFLFLFFRSWIPVSSSSRDGIFEIKQFSSWDESCSQLVALWQKFLTWFLSQSTSRFSTFPSSLADKPWYFLSWYLPLFPLDILVATALSNSSSSHILGLYINKNCPIVYPTTNIMSPLGHYTLFSLAHTFSPRPWHFQPDKQYYQRTVLPIVRVLTKRNRQLWLA